MLEVTVKSGESCSQFWKKERLQWEGFREKGFKSGMKEREGDKKLIIITNKCNC